MEAIVSGLNLARWNIMSNSHSSDYDQADMIEWQRLLRTLAFLEWYGYTPVVEAYVDF